MLIAVPDLVTNSYFPALAAEELGFYRTEGVDAHVELLAPALGAMAGRSRWPGAGSGHRRSHDPDGFSRVEGCEGGRRRCPGYAVAARASRRPPCCARGRAGRQRTTHRRGARTGRGAQTCPRRFRNRRRPRSRPDRPRAGDGAARHIVRRTAAAAALESGQIDGFWANALGSETAVRRGVGKIVVDVRRGDGPPGAGHYTFSALIVTEALIERSFEQVAAAVRAIVKAQRTLRANPARATEVGQRRFPAAASEMIAALVERDLPFYDPTVHEEAVRATNEFSRALGLLSEPVAYGQVASTSASARSGHAEAPPARTGRGDQGGRPRAISASTCSSVESVAVASA